MIMKIVNRFVVDDRNFYTIDDSGVTYATSERGLYAVDMLEMLRNSGYIIYDYHGSIATPDGDLIQQFPAEPVTITEDEIQQLIDCESYVLTEAEAAVYFTRNANITTVEFKKPVKITIKTREELVKYLYSCANRADNTMFEEDVLPLNSFVAPEALFEIGELFQDKSLRYLMRVIERRRMIKSYRGYKTLISFLKEYADLPENYTEDDVKNAYLSWGVCGIKTRATDVRTKFNVSTHIADEGKVSTAILRRSTLCLQDKYGNLISTAGKERFSDYEGDAATALIVPRRNKEYMQNCAETYKWSTEYKAIPCLVKESKTRTYIDYIDEDGCYFDVRVDVEQMIITSRTPNTVPILSAFLLIKSVDGNYDSIRRCIKQDEFYRWNVLIAKAQELVDNRTLKVPVKSSLQLVMEEGVSPEAALRYIADQIDTDPLGLNVASASDVKYKFAHAMYSEGPSSKALQRYNPEGLEYEDIEQLTEIFIAARDEQIETGTYLNPGEKPSTIEERLDMDMLAERPVENLEFVQMVKDGVITVDYLHRGVLIDNALADVRHIAELFEVLMREHNNMVDSIAFEYFVNSLENLVSPISGEKLIDINDVVKERTNAYYGYLKDKGLVNYRRIEQASRFIYITEIFREIANVPIEEQRHYAFRCLELIGSDATNKFVHDRVDILVSAIEDAVRNAGVLSSFEKDILKYSYKELAVNLLFSIALKTVKFVVVNGDYICKIPVELGTIKVDIDVLVPKDIAMYNYSNNLAYKYCTLSEYCEFEMTSKPIFNFYCVNAKINPWYVTPKYAKSLPTYNFVTNWVNNQVFANMSESIRSQLHTIKVDEINKHCTGEHYFVEITTEDKLSRNAVETGLNGQEAVFDYRLTTDSYEEMQNYYDRFMFYKKNAPDGKVLQRIPLRSDLVSRCYASWCNVVPVTDNLYVEETDVNVGKLYAQTREVIRAYKDSRIQQKALTMHLNSYEKFDMLHAGAQNLLRWRQIVEGDFECSAVCYIINGKLTIETTRGKVEIDICSELTRDDALRLCSNGVFYQLSAREFVVKTMNGLVKISVA